MRCPKCQYISFDSTDRCRNCGYELSLSTAGEQSIDVAIGREEPGSGRARDLSIGAMDTPITFAEMPGASDEAALGRALPSERDLPLFTDRVADDQAPLVTPPAVPRAPLSVRRTNPGGRRGRASADEPSFDLSADTSQPGDDAAAAAAAPIAEADGTAGLIRRGIAGVIDLAILAGIGAGVLYLTLRLCELTMDQWRLLPPVPLAAFLLLVAGGYFVLFTAAGGQTIGKMITRIRVVSGLAGQAPGDGVVHGGRVSFGTAVTRTVASLASVLPLGAGYLPAILSADRRALHDRIADTRVVSA